MVPFKGFYMNAEQKVFDVHVVGGRVGDVFVKALKSLHSGVLSTYLAWCVIGLGAIVFAVLTALLKEMSGR